MPLLQALLTPRRRPTPLARALLLAAAVCLAGLGRPDVGGGPDEALYVGTAREMAERGAWLTPTVDGAPSFYKPPLLFWAQRASFLLLGESTFAARLPAALCALGVAVVLALLARSMWGERAGAKAALVAASTLGLARFGRLAMTDLPLTLFVTLAAACAFWAAHNGKRGGLLWVGVAGGLALLTKGPVGAGLVVLATAPFLASCAPRLLRTREAAAAAGLCLLLGVPWFLASWALHGEAFVTFFFVRENLARLQGPWTLAGALKPLTSLLLLALPWTLLALPRAAERWARREEPRLLLCLLWVAGVLLPFALATVKHVHYVLPAVPAVALLASRPGAPPWVERVTAVALGALALGVLLALRLPFPLLARAGALLGALALACAALWLWRGARGVGAAGAVAVALALLFAWVLPALHPPLALPAPLEARQGPVYSYRLLLGSERRLVTVWTEGEARAALERGAPLALLARDAQSQGLLGVPGVAVRHRLSRLSRRLSPEAALAAWRAADSAPLLEEVWVLGRE
jgi:4-amino-4-deoxy-L-arabinose transferase-like glycosyltransferase